MDNITPNREPQPAHSNATTVLVPASASGPDREASLTSAQQQALECLFGGGSVTDAAKSAGVARQTVNRWIRDSLDFKTIYEAWHREMQESARDRLTAIGDAAMDNIVQAITINGDLRASQFVIRHLLGKKEK